MKYKSTGELMTSCTAKNNICISNMMGGKAI